MSASPMARQLTESRAIPTTKRVVVADPMDMPAEYSATPGGTLYSTTPGGSRIVYERAFLIKLSNSPLARSPPKEFDVPEALRRGAGASPSRDRLSPSQRNVMNILPRKTNLSPNAANQPTKQQQQPQQQKAPQPKPKAKRNSTAEDEEDAQFQMDM